jgi:O-antigen/teichoic acid export membrane protein
MINKLTVILGIVFRKPAHERDQVIWKNVWGSIFFQFLSNIIGLMVVPLSLSYIDKEKYGIWINASVIVTWLQNMNFGIGFGMQNKVAEALATGRKNGASDYITIVYRYSVFIALSLLLVCVIGSFFINWNGLFNSNLPGSDLSAVFFIALICFLIYFVLGNITPVFNALKQTSVPRLLGLFTNVFTVIFLYCIARFSHDNLVWAAVALAIPGPLVYIWANIFFFKRRYRSLRPKWKIEDKRHVKEVFTLGFGFFFMQLTTLVITQSGVFIITQYMGPAEVTPYSIINRYFYFAFFIFSLAISPYWSGFTEAYFKNDFQWIKKSIRRLLLAGLAGIAVIALMLALSFVVIPVWSHHSFDIYQYKTLVFTSALYTITLFFSSIIATFLNGLNLIRMQLFVQVIIAVLTIAISIILITKFSLGSTAINITAIIAQSLFIIVCGWRAYKFIKKRLHTSAE